jgi:hypothetical protein
MFVKSFSPKWNTAASIAAVILSIDIVTKYLAVLFLDGQTEYWIFGNSMCFTLRFNENFIGWGQAQNIFTVGSPRNVFFVGGISLFVCAALVAFFVTERTPPVFKVLIVVIALVVLSIIPTNVAAVIWKESMVGKFVSTIARVIGVFSILIVILHITRNKIIFALFAIQTSANIANILNYIIYTQGNVDFIYFPILRSFVGVTNFADLVMEPLPYAIVIMGLVLGICGVVLRLTKKPNSKQRRICIGLLRAY